MLQEVFRFMQVRLYRLSVRLSAAETGKCGQVRSYLQEEPSTLPVEGAPAVVL